MIIAFIYSWLVTFLLFAMVPVIFVVGILTVKGISVFNEKSKKAAEMAGKVYQVALNVCNKLSMQFPWIKLACQLPYSFQISVDSIDNIQTVAGYGLEERMFCEYERNMKIVKT